MRGWLLLLVGCGRLGFDPTDPLAGQDSRIDVPGALSDATRISSVGLVAYWPFDEGQGAIAGDASGNGHDGTIVGGTWAAGMFSSGLSMDGVDDELTAIDGPGLHLTGSATWSGWLFTVDVGVNDVEFVSRQRFNPRGWELSSTVDTGPRTCAVEVAVDFNTLTQRYGATTLDLGRWYMCTGVYDAATQQLDIYTNGVLDNGVLNGTVPAAQFDSPNAVHLMGRTDAPNAAGIIDDVVIYSRALSAAEVFALVQ